MGNNKKKNRDFVSTFGTAADVLQKLAQAVYARGGDDESMRLIVSDEVLRGQLADLIAGCLCQEPDVYTVTVDWGRTLTEMAASGWRSWVHGEYVGLNTVTTKTIATLVRQDCGPYRIPGEDLDGGSLELKLAYCGKERTDAQVAAGLNRLGLRPATMRELLAFWEKYSDVLKQFTVIALGSYCLDSDGFQFFPCVHQSDDNFLTVEPVWIGREGVWPNRYRFLAARQ
ncbi:MAG: hypothetical protein V1738_06035 [Patescibacteria group bacterium]